MSKKTVASVLLSSGLILGAASCSSEAPGDPAPTPSASPVLEPGEPNPMIAQGVSIPAGSPMYKTSGIGPAKMNTAAADGSAESYIDTDQFDGGTLPAGVTITEAQGINVLKSIRTNLEMQGLALDDVITMRVFLDNAPGTDRADYAGWNRAYRQFFANTNVDSGDTELVVMGTSEPSAPLERNTARPTRFALEVASLPVTGWLVEVEVDAMMGAPEGR